MRNNNIAVRIAFILTGSILSIFSIYSIYISLLDKEDFKTYSGKPQYARVDFKNEPSRRRHDFLNRDSISYVEMHIKLENLDKEFVIGNRLSDQFIIIKRLIQEANILTIRAKKDFFENQEYRVYQIDSNRRKDIVALEETTDASKGSVLFLILGLTIILFAIFGKIRRLEFEDDN